MKNTDLRSKALSAAVWVTAISAFGKLLGLLRESSLANYFGASVSTDAFKVAFNIPDIIIGIFSAAIAQTLIPVYNDSLNKGDKKESQRFLNNIFTITLLISIVIAITGTFFSSSLVRLIAPGMDEATARCAAQLSVIYPLLYRFARIAKAYHFCRHILPYTAAGSYYSMLRNLNSLCYKAVCLNPYIVSYCNWFYDKPKCRITHIVASGT